MTGSALACVEGDALKQCDWIRGNDDQARHPEMRKAPEGADLNFCLMTKADGQYPVHFKLPTTIGSNEMVATWPVAVLFVQSKY